MVSMVALEIRLLCVGPLHLIKRDEVVSYVGHSELPRLARFKWRAWNGL